MELNHRQQPGIDYIHPEKELYAGIWTLYAGATAFLAARLWVKTTRRHGLWYDDYILIVCWVRALHPLALASILETDSQLRSFLRATTSSSQ